MTKRLTTLFKTALAVVNRPAVRKRLVALVLAALAATGIALDPDMADLAAQIVIEIAQADLS